MTPDNGEHGARGARGAGGAGGAGTGGVSSRWEDVAARAAAQLPAMSVHDARALAASLAERYSQGPGPEIRRVMDGRIRVSGGFVPYRLLSPADHPAGLLVYYHGGGWVTGSVDGADALGRRLAARTGCAVLLAGYRLAPEYRYPTAVDDAHAALDWADAHLEELARPGAPIVVGGDGAGGNLAAVVAQRAKARKRPAVALQVLVCPVMDCDFDTTTYTTPDNQLLVTRSVMMWCWDHYAPVPEARLHPDASPLRLPDTAGLPPAVIVTAERDVLRAEAEVYWTRLLKSGIPVQHLRVPAQPHGLFTMPALPGSEAGFDFVTAAVERALGAGLPAG